MISQLKKLAKRDIIIIVIVFVLLLVLNIPLMFYIRKIGYQNSSETINLELTRIVEKIETNIFSRVQNAMVSLSKEAYLKQLLDKQSESDMLKDRVNLLLGNTKDILDLNTVYLMDETGEVIAGTTYGETSDTFVGNNYSFRPYFRKAMEGKNYSYGAVGKTSQERGFYFSSPVKKDDEILGVLVLKIDLQKIDRILDNFNKKVVLLSPQKIVFATNFSDFLYKSFVRNKESSIDNKQIQEQFGLESLTPLQIEFLNHRVKMKGQKYLYKESTLNVSDWSLVAFKEINSFFYGTGTKELFLLISSVVLLLGVIIVILLINRFYRIKLEKKLKKFSKTVEQSPLSVIITDLDGMIEYVNKRFEEVTGYQEDEVVGENPNILKSGLHSDEFYEELWESITNGKSWEGEFYNEKKNGDNYWENAKITPLIGNEGEIEAFIGIKEDITKEKQMKEKLEFFAERDELTNVYNRRMGTQLLKEKKQAVDDSGGCFSLAFIDINNLKIVNDVYGHEAGDELIVNVVDKIKENIRSYDVFARFGGDEFIIIFAGAEKKDAQEKLKSMQRELKDIDSQADYNYKASISYGVVEYYQDRIMNLDELISLADSRMYKFKEKYKEEHNLPKR